ncbi:membrane protein [Streptomyces xiamenensis]|uniref:Membrane protein n=1 Tax=Streptomyces xiamenensis TaxID=408015 RepID=A0A0F7FQW0_9ACTN|nr:DMT family transporter [Streptomyces xiamenensis]AKG41813.1 membrane protein [Streptomyces xiamenensis]
MRVDSSAIAPAPIAVATPAPAPIPATDRGGIALAAAGVLAFSFTLPGTAWAMDGLGPWTTTSLRIVLAALIAAVALRLTRTPRPERRHWAGLAVVACGTVIGFPLLTALALQTSSTSHSAVVIGLLPLTTAVYGTLRTGSRPSPAFWTAALAGAAAVVTFTLGTGGGSLTRGDLYLAAALLITAAAYGEGGRLARELPGWQVISWALLLSLPFAVPAAALALAAEPFEPTARSLAGLLWVALVSQFFGLVLWYRGLARAGVARASQLQLAQPLLTLAWAVLLLDEHMTWAAPVTALAVLACIAVTQLAPSRPEHARTDHQ